MKDTFSLLEVQALFAAAMQIARKQEAKWDSSAYRARHDRNGDAYNREYIKGIAEGYSYAITDLSRAIEAELAVHTPE